MFKPANEASIWYFACELLHAIVSGMARHSIPAMFFVSMLAVAASTRCVLADDTLPSAVLTSVREARTLVEQGYPEKAVSLLDAAIREHGDFGVLFMSRAALHQRADREHNAIDDLSRAIELGFRPALAYASRGASRLTIGDRKGAAADVDLAIKADPDLDVAYLLRGRLRYDDGRFPAALQDFERALSLEPNVEGYMGRALCQLRIGDYAAACVDATRASMIDPSDPAPIYIRAGAHLERGDEEAAAADYRLAERLEADSTR